MKIDHAAPASSSSIGPIAGIDPTPNQSSDLLVGDAYVKLGLATWRGTSVAGEEEDGSLRREWIRVLVGDDDLNVRRRARALRTRPLF